LSPAQIAHAGSDARSGLAQLQNGQQSSVARGRLHFSLLKRMRRHRHARDNKGQEKPSIPLFILIDQCPLEADQRLIAGQRENDPIIGKTNRSQLGVLPSKKDHRLKPLPNCRSRKTLST